MVVCPKNYKLFIEKWLTVVKYGAILLLQFVVGEIDAYSDRFV